MLSLSWRMDAILHTHPLSLKYRWMQHKSFITFCCVLCVLNLLTVRVWCSVLHIPEPSFQGQSDCTGVRLVSNASTLENRKRLFKRPSLFMWLHTTQANTDVPDANQKICRRSEHASWSSLSSFLRVVIGLLCWKTLTIELFVGESLHTWPRQSLVVTGIAVERKWFDILRKQRW